MGLGTYIPQTTAVRYTVETGGNKYFYSTSTDPLKPGDPYTYILQVYLSTGQAGAQNVSKTSISGTITAVVGELNKTIAELQQRAAFQQQTLDGLERELQNPNLTPAEQTALQARIDRFKSTTIADTQKGISDAQAAITEVQTNSTGIFQSTQQTLDQNIVPPNPTPTIDGNTSTGTGTSTTNSTNTLTGEASDESGAATGTGTSTTTGTTTGTSTTTGTTTGTGTESANTNAPTAPGTEREDENTDASTQGTPPYDNESFLRTATSDVLDKPGRRLKNPLGFLSSYTYQLSLYMISPDAYDAFVAGGRRNINLYNQQFSTSEAAVDAATDERSGGAFLIAQSGGIGGDDLRAEGFELDYYIDNLTIKSAIGSRDTGGPLGITEFKFQITEPYGFSLITKLRNAQSELLKNAGGKGNVESAPTKQFFVVGVRFHGYDQSGRPVNGSEIVDGNPLDPNANGGTDGAIFETFYDVVINKIKFKIDGRATVYDIEAATVGPTLSVNIKKGMINTNKDVSGSTVRDLLSGPNGLITKLNQEQQDLVKNKSVTVPTIYKVEWIGDAEKIAIASVVSENKTDKASQPASTAKTTTQVNDGTATKAAPNKNQQKMSFGNQTIIQAIDQVIARSKYLEDAMGFNYTDSKQNNPKTSGPNIGKTSQKKLTWFYISPEVSNITWDKKIKDWAYTITYKIQTYLIPAVDNPYASNKTKYYGPHKKYNYWYSGENSEIIGYEQRLDNAFFSVVVAGDPKSDSTQSSESADTGPSSTSTGVNMQPGGDKSNDGGTLSGAAVNSIRTSLYDPHALARAKIQILGDPDYLMQEVPSGTTGLNQAYSKHYGPGYTINPTGGQVFFEIDFKEAVDYSTDDVNMPFADGKGVTGQGGTLSINDSILFWKYPDEMKGLVNGIVYTLTTVTSNFRGGGFFQTLDAYVETFSEEKALTTEDQVTLDQEAPAAEGAPGENIDSGTLPDNPPATGSTPDKTPQPAAKPATT
jgi:hypothetical protein